MRINAISNAHESLQALLPVKRFNFTSFSEMKLVKVIRFFSSLDYVYMMENKYRTSQEIGERPIQASLSENYVMNDNRYLLVMQRLDPKHFTYT